MKNQAEHSDSDVVAVGSQGVLEGEDGLVTRRNLGVALASGAFWTLAGYGASQLIRFATSLILTRLLAPELFGIMVIVNTVRTGAELLSDIGIAQSVIRSPNGEEPRYYNTAWTLQILRGILIAVLCSIAALPIALIYNLPIVSSLLPAAALTLVISGFTSIGLPLLRRRLNFRRLAVFEVLTAGGYSIFQIGIAYLYPSVWALVLGLIMGSIITASASYALVPQLRQKLIIDKESLSDVFGFGKWITASSTIFFITANFDRIFLPTVMSLQTLGIYSVARTVVDIVIGVFVRLSNSILFPFIASRQHEPTQQLRTEIAAQRSKFLFVSSLGIGLLSGTVDILVESIFDSRYHGAGGMASMLILGGWFAILAQLGESALMGLGRPQAATFSNSAKLLWLVVALPMAFNIGGTNAAIAVIVASDLFRYLITLPMQRQKSFSFLCQDLVATVAVAAVVILIFLLRFQLGISPPAWLP